MFPAKIFIRATIDHCQIFYKVRHQTKTNPSPLFIRQLVSKLVKWLLGIINRYLAVTVLSKSNLWYCVHSSWYLPVALTSSNRCFFVIVHAVIYVPWTIDVAFLLENLCHQRFAYTRTVRAYIWGNAMSRTAKTRPPVAKICRFSYVYTVAHCADIMVHATDLPNGSESYSANRKIR